MTEPRLMVLRTASAPGTAQARHPKAQTCLETLDMAPCHWRRAPASRVRRCNAASERRRVCSKRSGINCCRTTAFHYCPCPPARRADRCPSRADRDLRPALARGQRRVIRRIKACAAFDPQLERALRTRELERRVGLRRFAERMARDGSLRVPDGVHVVEVLACGHRVRAVR